MDGPELVRTVNGHILRVAEQFGAGLVPEDLPVDFFCECGCWQTVHETPAEFREYGAWVAGHREKPGERPFAIRRVS